MPTVKQKSHRKSRKSNSTKKRRSRRKPVQMPFEDALGIVFEGHRGVWYASNCKCALCLHWYLTNDGSVVDCGELPLACGHLAPPACNTGVHSPGQTEQPSFPNLLTGEGESSK